MLSSLGRAIGLVALCAVIPAWSQAPVEDGDRLYRYLIQQNKAQLAMLAEGKLLPREQVRRLAAALAEIDEANRRKGTPPSTNYLDLEEQLVAKLGPEASNIHLGRSRNDLGATSERLTMREEILALLGDLAETRESLLALASENVDTVIPGYTHAVQAQPTTLAHMLSGTIYAMERDEQRLREAYGRINASPLGAAAFTTSGVRLDRNRLRDLLGFTTLVENSYDAIMVSTVDSKAEFASALAIAALNTGRFAQQFVTQYSDSRPGLNLSEEAVGHSSIMPQKRNPRQAERVRILASGVLGDAQTVLITTHNTPGGEVADIRVPLLERVQQVSRGASAMFRLMTELVRSIRVDSARTLELVNADYSVMTEVADTLFREAGVPFRTGHKVASELAAYGRAKGKRPMDLSFEEVGSVYRAATGAALPLTEEQVRTALSAEGFVRGRRGIGGPQPEEMRRMLAGHRSRLESLRSWVDAERARIRTAEEELEAVFQSLK